MQGVLANSLNCERCMRSHVPTAAQCVMASEEHDSGRLGGESNGKLDVRKYFDKNAGSAMFT